jgi:hypothetical protein
MRDSEELTQLKQLKQERIDRIEARMLEAEEAKRQEVELIIARQKAVIAEEETRVLSKFSKTQREELMRQFQPEEEEWQGEEEAITDVDAKVEPTVSEGEVVEEVIIEVNEQ